MPTGQGPYGTNQRPGAIETQKVRDCSANSPSPKKLAKPWCRAAAGRAVMRRALHAAAGKRQPHRPASRAVPLAPCQPHFTPSESLPAPAAQACLFRPRRARTWLPSPPLPIVRASVAQEPILMPRAGGGGRSRAPMHAGEQRATSRGGGEPQRSTPWIGALRQRCNADALSTFGALVLCGQPEVSSLPGRCVAPSSCSRPLGWPVLA